ncbi:glycosyltransferase [Anaerosphaera multitolerans]|uniref:Glycosyltransferase family 4 protein n=1 Tax=Anaerosphaera multitolerans TaxID=2487351 RepID=A0A437S6G4_9FIRM|nr:glycosyltransferase [Anaerosphaera multitolerans]RVU54580.1 glycosyltransferase family 4 protein [Anaerosphaera multitolerans]
MKVLITTDVFKPQINGVVTSVLNLYDELKKMGVDVKILTLSNTLNSRREGDVYYAGSFPLKVYPDIRASLHLNRDILRELIDWRPDIIHTQCEFSTLIFAKVVAKKTKCPIIHTYHTMYEHYVRYIIKYDRVGKKLVSVGMKQLLKKCNCIVAPTRKVKVALKKYNLTNKVAVIPTGIDLSLFNREVEEGEIEKIKEKYGIAKDNFIILSLGRVAAEKNIDELIDFFGESFEDKNKFTLLIVGDGPYKSELEKKVKNLGCINIVFTGMISPENIYKIYRMSDVYVSSSKSETQGLTYIEAMANSLPLVCRKDDCLEEMLKNGVNGYYFNNREEFTKGINKIFKNRDLKEKMSKNSKSISVRFSKEYFASSIFSLYKEIIMNYRYIPITKRGYYKLRSTFKNLYRF